MKKFLRGSIFILFCLCLPATLMAQDYLAEAQVLFDQGGVDNLKKAGDLYLKYIEANPNSYEAHWKAAQAYRNYGDEANKAQVDGWKDICKEYGNKAMALAEKATEIEPDKVEGYYFYGLSVAVYSDGTGIMTAIREGLKGKTQSSLEKAYEIDKMYNDGGPMIALGRFWFVLPGIAGRDVDKSVELLREFQQNFPDDPEGQIYLAESLLKKNKKEYADEAKGLLEKAVLNGDADQKAEAEKLLQKL
ncbi:MAG: hypothetical protein JW920_04830 [Deltaproteobacteria bacterium]|nr:hypothetical protein [Deltaproteobacteria bacterium]